MMTDLTTSVGARRLERTPLIFVFTPMQFGKWGKRGKKICVLDQSLVDAKLKGIPGLATLTTRGLSRRDFQVASL